MILTKDILALTMPNAGMTRVELFAAPLAKAMASYQVDSELEIAAFVATIAEESGELHFLREIWGPTSAQLNYEGSVALGNTQPGDGHRYLGRGLIQVTGRENYQRMGALMDLPLIEQPQLLEEPVYAAFSACAFWWDRGLNNVAARSDFKRVTRLVNGGLTNYARREIFYVRAKEALGIS